MRSFRVAAADVKPVPPQDGVPAVERLGHPPRPALVPDRLAGVLAELLVERLPVAERRLGQLQLGHHAAVVVQGGTQPRPEGHEDLEADALDDADAGELGVVDHQDGLAEHLGELRGGVQADPRGHQVGTRRGERAGLRHEVRGGQDLAAPDHPRQAHRDAVVGRQLRGDAEQGRGHQLDGERVRGADAHAVRERLAGRVQHGALEPGAPAVQRQRALTGIRHGPTITGGPPGAA